MTGKIDVNLLVDQYVERFEDEYIWPSIYRIAVDDQRWLTDGKWIIAESFCSIAPETCKVRDVPAKNAFAKAAEYIAQVSSAELTPTKDRFAPAYAGVLAEAGCILQGGDAATLTGSVIVAEDGTRLGLLMGLKPNCGGPSLPGRVKPETVLMKQRLLGMHAGIELWQAWVLAAGLTS